MKIGSRMMVVSLLVFATPALAGPADKVFTPDIGYGESELGLKSGAASPLAGKRAEVVSVSYGHGMRENWFTEVSLKQSRGVQNATMVEWENKFLLASRGEHLLDIGFLTEIEIPLAGKAVSEMRFGPLFQTRSGNWQLNGNVLFEHPFGGLDEDNVAVGTNLSYQWQLKYHWREVLEFGMQGFGELGKWNNWARSAQQNHRVGPALFGELALDEDHAVKYSAAWLFGASAAAPNHTFRLNLEYEF
ncbi:MAG: hypothetical protein PHH47_10885 [Gallionella sp.]|nr:hypothetical protein [Gallionella sp.]MDD4947063.1 hypothetical protein [Gallionella sp.]MDD5612061.1 hypothetical protein [Gallionella sp.]